MTIPWTLHTPGHGEDSSFPRALATSVRFARWDPPGANDWSCTPSAAHPEPVILLHGAFENAYSNWSGLAPILKEHGYCVFALNYGHVAGMPAGVNGTGDLVASARQIAAFVSRVAVATGAKHVALIGHSQGGAQARYVANLLLPAGLVDKVIGIAPSNHQTTLSGLNSLANALGLTRAGVAVMNALKMPGQAQQGIGVDVPFYANLNGAGETRPGIAYTTVASKNDRVVTPYTRAFLSAGAGVDNITLQDVCASDRAGHLALCYSTTVAQIVLNALDPEHPHAIMCPSSSVPGRGSRSAWSGTRSRRETR